MAKYMHPDLMDFGLDRIRAQIAAAATVKVHVIKAYTQGDSYATVAGNSVGSVALATGDLTLADQGTLGRQVTVASKSITAASAGSGASPNLHQAVLDETNSKVLFVTDETTDQVVASGNPITTFAMVLKTNQPT